MSAFLVSYGRKISPLYSRRHMRLSRMKHLLISKMSTKQQLPEDSRRKCLAKNWPALWGMMIIGMRYVHPSPIRLVGLSPPCTPKNREAHLTLKHHATPNLKYEINQRTRHANGTCSTIIPAEEGGSYNRTASEPPVEVTMRLVLS